MNINNGNQQELYILSVPDSLSLQTCSLILSAVDIPYRINAGDDNTFEFVVPASLKERALYEIASYEQENRDWPPPPPAAPAFAPSFKAMSFLVIGSLIFIFSLSGDWHPESVYFQRGAGDSSAILLGGEYYRLITALMLHADIVHLMGNCFLGGFLLHFYFKLTGNGLGLFAMLLTATIANFINVLVHGQGHHFVGFSTAVFSVIGILCTLGYIRSRSIINLHLFMPIMAGVALLAMLGSGGERTDIGAHFFGLAVGLAGGLILRSRKAKTIRDSTAIQIILGTAACSAAWISWSMALGGRTL
ncbi:MAG: rhomboid family intramembrane serine protease [Deltaproteobacteria bacterium]|nr:rhomboid family intramembrane serine protease [Deltaproteobacteria bacterium]